MVFQPGFRARILNGDFSLSAKLTDISLPVSVEMLDSTTFADNGAKRSIPGLDHSTFSCDGFVDAETNTDVAAWVDAQPFTYAREGLALGSPTILVNGLKSSYEPGTQVGGISSFSLSGETDGPASFGVSLHDLTAETATLNGTGVDGGAASTNGGVAHLHVTAYSGLTSATVVVADSADNVSFATIGSFTAATAATSQRLAITGTIRRYTRYTLTAVGTGSVTFACALARH